MNGGEETFLLVTAALANLTFMSPLSSAAMKRCGTPEALVKAVKRSPFTTLFAKDQVVTVLANMAANANCRHDIEAIDGVGFLLSMLETSLNGTNSKSELSAAERVQKKSAIALSRYFDNSNFAKKMLKIIRLKNRKKIVNLFMVKNLRNFFAFLHFYVFGFFFAFEAFLIFCGFLLQFFAFLHFFFSILQVM